MRIHAFTQSEDARFWRQCQTHYYEFKAPVLARLCESTFVERALRYKAPRYAPTKTRRSISLHNPHTNYSRQATSTDYITQGFLHHLSSRTRSSTTIRTRFFSTYRSVMSNTRTTNALYARYHTIEAIRRAEFADFISVPSTNTNINAVHPISKPWLREELIP